MRCSMPSVPSLVAVVLALAPVAALAGDRDLDLYQEPFARSVLRTDPTPVVHDGSTYTEAFAPSPGTGRSRADSPHACARSCPCHSG